MAVRLDAGDTAYTATLNAGAQAAYTIAGWMKISVDRNAASTFASLESSAADYTIMQTAADGTTLNLSDSFGIGPGTIALSADVWYFVALSMSGGSGTMYARADGAGSWSTAAQSGMDPSVTCTTLRVGDSQFAEPLNGCVTSVRVWSAALSQAELDAEFISHYPVRTSGLQGWYALSSTGDTVDRSGNNRNLTGGTGATTESGPAVAEPLGMFAPYPTWPGDGPDVPRRFMSDPRAVVDVLAGIRIIEAGGTAYATANATTITSASFTPANGSLLVAFCSMGNGTGGASSLGAVTDSLGGTWTRLSGEASASGGVAEIWARDIATGAAMTVTYDPGGAGASGLNLACFWYTNAAPVAQQPGVTAVNGGGTSYATSITTTVAGSMVAGALGRASDAQTLIPNADTGLIGQVNGSAGDTAALFRSAFTIVPGGLILGFANDPAGVNRIALAEIIPPPAAGAGTAEAGRAPLGIATTGTATRVQAEVGTAPLGVATAGAARHLGTAAGLAPLGVATRGTAAKRTAAAGLTAAAVTTTGQAVKRTAQAGTVSFGVTGTGQAVKRQAHTGAAPTGLTTTGRAVRVAPQRGPASLGVATVGAAAKKAPQAGSAPLTVSTWQTTALVPRAVEGRLALSIATLGTARKVATGQTGQATLGVAPSGVAAKRTAAAGVATVGAATRTAAVTGHGTGGRAFVGFSGAAAGRKAGAATGSTAAGFTSTGRAVKRATPTGAAPLAVIATAGTLTKRVACRGTAPLALTATIDPSMQARVVSGRCAFGIATWHKNRFTRRPNTGTTPRPSSGVTVRPATGATIRPSSGVTVRPYAGTTLRP